MILVETVVGEMDVGVAEVFFGWLLVVFCAEPGESFFVEVADVGRDGRDEDI